jgi:HEAT repeat protein
MKKYYPNGLLFFQKFLPIPDRISYCPWIEKEQNAVPLVKSALNNSDNMVRKEAAFAIASLEGKEAVPSLIDYMLKNSSPEDQAAAKKALMTVINGENINLIIPVLKDASPAAKKTAIELIAWNRDPKYFAEIFPFTSSQDETVNNAAYKALADVFSVDDQEKLISLITSTDKPEHIADIRNALIKSSNMISDPKSDRIYY